MKKAILIIVLGLLFISIDLSNPTRVEAGWFDDINPLKYFEKRKKCKEESERMETTRLEKMRYKDCMNDE